MEPDHRPKMDDSNLVSVILPTYNREVLLKQSIDSVLNQSYANLELIVIDDASTDKTSNLVKSYSDNRILYIKHNENKHASASRNTGIRKAKGKYLAVLDDDDTWLPHKLEMQVSLLNNCPESTGLIYCWMDYRNKNNEITATIKPALKGYIFGNVLDKQRVGGCPTLLIRKSVISKCGLFDESLLRGNDGDFIRRICLQYEVDLIPEVLVNVKTDHGMKRISDNNKSGLNASLISYTSRLEKFKNILHQYPIQTSNIYASIAYHHIILGNNKHAIHYLIKSLLVNVTGLYKYRIFFKAMKDRISNKSSKISDT